MWLAGTPDGPEGALAPNITPDPETGIGRWSAGDVVQLLKTGRKPNFDDVQGAMEEAIGHGFKLLSDEDLQAVADYLRALPAVSHRVERKRP